MTDREKLTTILLESPNLSTYDRIGGHPLVSDERCDEKCKEHCLDWLKQPARGGDNDG